MDDAQTLFQEGIHALREKKDIAEGRRLLIESLRANPQNDMAWVWLARVTRQPEKQLELLDRALRINPDNAQALQLRARLAPVSDGQAAGDADEHEAKTAEQSLSPQEEQRIAMLLKRANHSIDTGDPEAAIERWVDVLDIQVDHEEALRNAVAYLARLKYLDDARELVWRAIDAGTTHPSVYLTAIDIANRQSNYPEADDLRERLARLPDIDDKILSGIVQHFVNDDQFMRVEYLLKDLIEAHPTSQPLLTAMGDVYRAMENETEALRYYDRAARIGAGTKAGRAADKKLANYAPVLTDTERGSLLLAWREAAGFGLLYLFLAWQDAGLDLLQLGLMRWVGVLMSVLGGYLVITATSSPQQQPIARWLGGYVPSPKPAREANHQIGPVEEPTQLPIIPPAARLAAGLVGAVVLAAAAWLVFNTAFRLLLNPVPPDYVPTLEDLLYGRWW